MKYLMFNFKSGVPMIIKPDIDAHMNSHPIITWTYSVFRNQNVFYEDVEMPTPVLIEDGRLKLMQNGEDLDKKLEEGYIGFMTIEEPDGKITYTHEGEDDLNPDEIEEVLDQIEHYRNNSGLWKY